ncbi:hypothetical protein [Bacillus sp. BHET2]|uniref:hypothetical protein n=1 Tax=Bacillus sp. BHET2 TaxID=2583818 RepID=UPI0014862F4A|nr:hypothetical protein [Bacillus sp. BHET2]
MYVRIQHLGGGIDDTRGKPKPKMPLKIGSPPNGEDVDELTSFMSDGEYIGDEE